jgi:beta-xylosidase
MSFSFGSEPAGIPKPEQEYTGNPIMPGKGVCDPSVRIFNGKAYLYATHDSQPGAPERKGQKGRNFHMVDWWVWSSTNLRDWKYECSLSPTALGFPEGFKDCWAPDALGRNGKYYWYVCSPENTYVVRSDTPTGPWEAPLGNKPLMRGRDPAPFIDDDGEAYLITGVWIYDIAKLGSDMISLAESPRKIVINNPEGPSGKGKTDDKPYLHKRNGWYYLSWGCYYAMSRNIYGPYECKGSVLKPENIEKAMEQQGWNSDRHGSFFEWRGQWYYIFNSTAVPQSDICRDSAIVEVYYEDNGEIKPVHLTAKGVALKH